MVSAPILKLGPLNYEILNLATCNARLTGDQMVIGKWYAILINAKWSLQEWVVVQLNRIH